MNSTNSENNISLYTMEQEIQNLLSQDPKAPKRIRIKGKFTKTFRKWNEKAIREGKTFNYLPGDKLLKFYKNGNSRFIPIKYDSRYKNKRVVSKKFKKQNPTYSDRQGSVLPIAQADFEKEYEVGEGDNEYSFWRDLLQPFEGQNIRVVIKTGEIDLDEEVTTSFVGSTENYTDVKGAFISNLKTNFDGYKNIVFNQEFDLPNILSSSVWNSGKYYNRFMINSQWVNIVSYLTQALKVTCKVFITKLVKLKPIQLYQSFNEGGGCLLKPILEFFKEQSETVKSKDSKKKYLTAINHIQGKQLNTEFKRGLLQEYADGVPQERLQEVCDKLQIGIDIYLPFKTESYLSCRSHKKPRKVFKFINRTINHVEVSHVKHQDENTVYFTRTEIEDKLSELEKKGLTPYYSRDAYGVTAIYDIEKLYKLKNPYRDAVNEWEKQNNISSYKIDALKYPDVVKFIGMACKFNGCRDFVNIKNVNIDECSHIDIRKAYTQFHKSQYYNGFVGKITDFRMCNDWKINGFYLIKDLDLSKANQKFVNINEKLKWFANKNVYTTAELRALQKNGGKFKVISGAYGIRTDFKFNKDLIDGKIKCFGVNGKEVKISYYAKLVGEYAAIHYDSSFNMKGDKRFFENMVNQGFNIFYNDYDNEATIKFPKPNVSTLKHLSAQITAYQRLLVLDQLMEMDIEKVVRVCVDGIYYYDHDYKDRDLIISDKSDLWADKSDEKTFNNGQCASYVSGLMDNEMEKLLNENDYKSVYKIILGMKFGMRRPFYRTEFIGGQGGTGKSYNELHDWGVVGGCYISPSWKLASHQAKEIATGTYNHTTDTSVFHYLLTMDHEYKLTKRYNHLFIDECSMITQCEKEKILNMFSGKITFMGDLGYQLEPVLTESHKNKLRKSGMKYYDFINEYKLYEMRLDGIDNKIYYEIDRRAKDCKELQKLKLDLRQLIIDGKNAGDKDEREAIKQKGIDKVKSCCEKANLKDYNKKDLILASKHEFNQEYDKQFSHLEKYKITCNTREYKNGEIVFTKPEGGVKYQLKHGYTIHEIQGETSERKLFIDLRELFSDRMLYTAISRARKISQIRLIY